MSWLSEHASLTHLLQFPADALLNSGNVLFTGSEDAYLEARLRVLAKLQAAENLYFVLDALIRTIRHPCWKKAHLSRGETSDRNTMERTLLEQHIKLRHK